MLEIGFDAIAFFAGLEMVRWYTVLQVLGIAIWFVSIYFEAKRLKIPLKHMCIMLPLIFLVGIILAKITDIVGRPEHYGQYPQKMFSLAGLRAPGLFVGTFLVELVYCWKVKLSFWSVTDALAPGAALMTAIIRAGCLINGCCYGIACPIPWLAITYTGQHSLAPLNVPLYPVQLYGVIWFLIVSVILWLLRKKLQPAGSLYLLFTILFAGGDFIIRLFRQPDAVLLGIQIQQFLNVIMFLIALPLFIIRRKRYHLSSR